MSTKKCVSCMRDLLKSEFSNKQWGCRQVRRCKECIAGGTTESNTASEAGDEEEVKVGGPATRRSAQLTQGEGDYGRTVYLTGLSRADLNGEWGTIMSWNDVTSRYAVEVRCRKLAIKAVNVQLSATERVHAEDEDDDDGGVVELFNPASSADRFTADHPDDFRNNTDKIPIVRAFELCMPLSSKMVLMQESFGVVGKSVHDISAAAQWLWTILHTVQNPSARLLLIRKEDGGGDAPAIFLEVIGGTIGETVLAAPETLRGVKAGYPVIPVAVTTGTLREVQAVEESTSGRLQVLCCQTNAESEAQIVYGQMELQRRRRLVDPVYLGRHPTASFLAPPAGLLDPEPPKEREVCGGCGRRRAHGERKFQNCARCNGATYCSRECQKQDWKTHKKFCRKRDDAACGAGSSTDGCPSALVSMIPPAYMHGLVSATMSFSGANIRSSKQMEREAKRIGDRAPRNTHGSDRFIVKLQVHETYGTPAMAYDRNRTFTSHLDLPRDLWEFVHAERATAVPGMGNKAYVYARREGENIRFFMDKRAPLQNW